MGRTCRGWWDLDSATGCGGWLVHLRTSPKRFSMMPAALTNLSTGIHTLQTTAGEAVSQTEGNIAL